MFLKVVTGELEERDKAEFWGQVHYFSILVKDEDLKILDLFLRKNTFITRSNAEANLVLFSGESALIFISSDVLRSSQMSYSFRHLMAQFSCFCMDPQNCLAFT